MRRAVLTLIVVLSGIIPAQASAQFTTPDPRFPMISASGTAEVSRAPDYAVVTIGLLAKGSTPGGTTRELDRLLDVVRDTLRAHGLADTSIRSGTRRLEPQRTYPARDITGYTAGISLTVSLRALDRLGVLLDALAAAGATEIPEVRFESDDKDAAYEEALGLAVDEATRRAGGAARAAGGRLGPVVLIAPDDRFGFLVDRDYTDMEAPQAQQAKATTRASVTIHWRFEGR
jgi:uncharacterized protein YggE